MTETDQRIRELITRQAADWFVGNRAGPGVQQRADFTAWLKASPVHIEEYLAIAVVGRDLRAACALSAESLEELITRARTEPDPSVEPLRGRDFSGDDASSASSSWFRWQTAALTFASVCVLILAMLAVRNYRLTAPVAQPVETAALHFETRHGEQQTVRLADNSVVHLNTDSAVTVRFSGAQRLVVLNAGEADFDVAHEPARAFKVLAGAARIVAIGTKFDVRLNSNATVVAVVEGRVAVGPTSPSDDPRTIAHQGADTLADTVQLEANQQISVSGNAWPTAVETVDTRQTTAWLHRQIMFQHEPLERVANEFNRYAPTPFEIATPGLRTLEISGVFATDDTDAFIAFLRSLDGVRVEVTATRIRVLQD